VQLVLACQSSVLLDDPLDELDELSVELLEEPLVELLDESKSEISMKYSIQEEIKALKLAAVENPG
jgi:ABC-type nitrate/sulfonate/bicarbonate transport system ATPase subunit